MQPVYPALHTGCLQCWLQQTRQLGVGPQGVTTPSSQTLLGIGGVGGGHFGIHGAEAISQPTTRSLAGNESSTCSPSLAIARWLTSTTET